MTEGISSHSIARQSCPICGQDWVVPVRLKTADKIIYVCKESEETWFEEQDIIPGTFAPVPTHGHYSYLSFVMESYGLGPYDYDQLEWLETKT